MPVVMNQRDKGSKSSEEKKPAMRLQAVTKGGLLSDVKTVTAIFAGAILLVLGLLAWSQGWIGGAVAAPANTASHTAGKTTVPMGGSDADNLMGKKRNKGMGE